MSGALLLSVAMVWIPGWLKAYAVQWPRIDSVQSPSTDVATAPGGLMPSELSDSLPWNKNLECSPADCPHLCRSAGRGEAQGAGLFATCRATCHGLDEQCCTFCLYSSYSVSSLEGDSNAPRSGCIERCSSEVQQQLLQQLPPLPIGEGTGPAAVSPAPAPPPMLPAAIIAPVPVAAQYAAPHSSSTTGPSAALPASSQWRVGGAMKTYPLLVKCDHCSGNSASWCHRAYDDCEASCLVIFSAVDGSQDCDQQCATTVCSSAAARLAPQLVKFYQPTIMSLVQPIRARLPPPHPPKIFPQGLKAMFSMYPDLANAEPQDLRSALLARTEDGE